jgi:membrane protein DedA with SNARE-associated domain
MDPTTLLALIAQFRYPIIVPAALVWGILVGMLVGVAVRLGTLELIPAYFCIMLGELIGDVIWYWIGYRWGESFIKRFGRYVSLTDAHIVRAKQLFATYNQRILFSSKLTTGFGFSIPILFTAGMTKMSFWRYMRANMAGQFLWSGGLILVGYFFGDLYISINSTFGKISVITFVLIAVACFFGFMRYLRSRLL